MNIPGKIVAAAIAAVAMIFATGAGAQEVKHYRFRPRPAARNTGYSIAYDLFSARLKELSKGTMLIDQFPGAQLGQEPQTPATGQIGRYRFCDRFFGQYLDDLAASRRDVAAYLFRSEDQTIKALADPKVFEAIRGMIDDTAQGIHAIGSASQGFRHMYGKKEVHNVDDLKGYEGPRAGDRDRRYDVCRLWCADRAHAVRQCLYVAADRCDGCRRERSQRLSRQQALRSRAGAVDDRA